MTERVDPRLLAAHPAPGTLLDELSRCPVHPADDGWYVAGRPRDVDELLGHPAARVGVVRAEGDAIAAVQTRMARFSDGDDHRRRRDAAAAVLRGLDPGEARRATSRAVDVYLRPGSIDLMPLARRVPATVLAHELDLPEPSVAVDAVDLLCRRLAPATADVERPDGARVADALSWAFGSLDDDAVVARVSVLFQAMDATAALVAAAVLARIGRPGPDQATPPIMLTSRTLAEGCRIGGVSLPAGARVLVHLGAASAAGGSRTFGRGPHACPGADVARAIAAGFVDALARHRVAQADPGRPLTYEPRPNLRVPTRLAVVVS